MPNKKNPNAKNPKIRNTSGLFAFQYFLRLLFDVLLWIVVDWNNVNKTLSLYLSMFLKLFFSQLIPVARETDGSVQLVAALLTYFMNTNQLLNGRKMD